MDEPEHVPEKLFKVIIVGDSLAGKTAFLNRYVSGHFDPEFKTTVTRDFALKKIVRPNDGVVKLQLWDITGAERYGSMTRLYYKEASACVIMFDVMSRRSFDSVMIWKNDVDKKVMLSNGNPVPCLLLANKGDLPSPNVRDEEIKELSSKENFVGSYKISVKDNTNIEQSMNFLVDEILAHSFEEMSILDSDGRIVVDKQSNIKSRIPCSIL